MGYRSSQKHYYIAVKALEFGAYGYLPKVAVASDRNLLLYAIRLAIERKSQIAAFEQSQQQQELDILESLLAETAESDSSSDDSLSKPMPDIYAELEVSYRQLLDRFVEHDLSGQINILIEQLGYLQATSEDLLKLHTAILKQKQTSIKDKNARASMVEGCYLLLLMSKLAAYYRRYYIGLNKINLAQSYLKTTSSD